MRLFRRSLLCLGVGVTAFGAAGWLLRPKPTWEIEVATGARFLDSVNSGSNSDLILLSIPDPDCNWLIAGIVVVAPADGERRQTFRPPENFTFDRDFVNLPDGRLLFDAHVPMLKDRVNLIRTWFGVLDLARTKFESECTLEGDWKATTIGDAAWMILKTSGGFKIVFRRFFDGVKSK